MHCNRLTIIILIMSAVFIAPADAAFAGESYPVPGIYEVEMVEKKQIPGMGEKSSDLMMKSGKSDLEKVGIYERFVDLDALVMKMLRDNPEIRMMRKQIKASEMAPPQKLPWPDPMVGLMYGQVPGFANPRFIGQALWVLKVSQVIPGGKKRVLAAEIADADTLRFREQYLDRVQSLISRIQGLYFQLYEIQQTIKVKRKYIELAQHLVKFSEVQYEVGRVQQADVLKAQLELSKLYDDLIELDERQEIVTARINNLVASPPSERLGVVEDVPYIPKRESLDEKRLQQLAITNRHDLKMIMTVVEKIQRRKRFAMEQLKPDYRVEAGARQFSGGHNDYTLMVSMNIPVNTRKRVEYELKEYEVRIQQTNALYNMRRNRIFLDIRDALSRIRAAGRRLELLNNTLIPQGRQTLKSSLANYETGNVNFNTIIDNERLLLGFELARIKSEVKLLKARTDLEYAVGDSTANLKQLLYNRSHRSALLERGAEGGK